MSQKGLALILIVLILAALVGGYLVYQRQKSLCCEMKPSGPLCDLNEDGKCDTTDFNLFKQALGKKVGDVGYNLSADVNADGVVTNVDAEMLQFPFPITLPKDAPSP